MTNPNVIHIILLRLRSTMNTNRQMAKEFDNFVLLTWGNGESPVNEIMKTPQSILNIKSVP